MRILIVEDEASVAARVERLTRQVLENRIERIAVRSTLAAGMHYLQEHTIDMLLLDLNLNGEDGFSLLKGLVSYSFHTIIISANTHQALEAFEYGVLDFIPKPFTTERLAKAFNRYHESSPEGTPSLQYLTVRQRGTVRVVDNKEVMYIQGAGNYSELYLLNGTSLLHDKSLNKLQAVLPAYFRRIHRSYICNWQYIHQLHNHGAGKYELELQSGARLPVSRSKYAALSAL
jgi:two-component system response regulator LytT